MPISVAGEVGHNEASVLTNIIIVTLSGGVAVGHMAAAGIVNATPAQSVSSVTDSKGNTWTVRSSINGSNARGTIAESVITNALVAGDTVTVNFTGNTASQLVSVADASGQAVSPHDQGGTNNATGTNAFAVSSGSTTQADEVAFVVYGYGSSSGTPFASNGGYTPVADRFGTNRGIWFGYRILTVTGIEAASQTCGASNSYAAAIDTYKAAAAPASAPVRSVRVGRSRAALRARLRRRRPSLLRGRSVTTPTPLVRPSVYAKRHRRGAIVARRKHRNVVYSRPPARFAPLAFVRPAILVVRHARQALLARRKHDRAVVLRSPQAPPRPRPPIVVTRRQPRLVARRKHRTVTPAVRPPAVSVFRRAAQIIVRKARAPLDARRKHRTGLLTRPRVEQPPPRRAPLLHRGRVRRLIRRFPHLIRPASRPAAAPAQPVAVHAELGDRPATDATITDTLAVAVRFGDSPTLAAVTDDTDATEATTRDIPTPGATTDDGP